MTNLISVGKILNFHGVKGEVKMGFTAGREALIKKLKQVFIFVDNVKTTFDVESVRFHKNIAIIKFKQINSIDEVMSVKGLLVHVTEGTLKSGLQNDEFLIKDLIGLIVVASTNFEDSMPGISFEIQKKFNIVLMMQIFVFIWRRSSSLI